MRSGLVTAGALRSEVYRFGRSASVLLYVEAAGCSAFPSTQNGILAAFFGGEAPPPGAGTVLVLILDFACWGPPVLPVVANEGMGWAVGKGKVSTVLPFFGMLGVTD
jgi:hypothetical protein